MFDHSYLVIVDTSKLGGDYKPRCHRLTLIIFNISLVFFDRMTVCLSVCLFARLFKMFCALFYIKCGRVVHRDTGSNRLNSVDSYFVKFLLSRAQPKLLSIYPDKSATIEVRQWTERRNSLTAVDWRSLLAQLELLLPWGARRVLFIKRRGSRVEQFGRRRM